MPIKWSPGCGCCGDTCKATKNYDATSDWITGTGGSVASDGSGGLDIDGPVDPASFLSAEAYQIEFGLKGFVTFDIGGVTIAADADAQTVTAGTTTIECGQSAGSPLSLTVYIRVTPSHIFILGIGNYGTARQDYGIATADRSGAVPSTFSVTWSSANISGFQITDATVKVSSGYDTSLECWTAPDVDCPYLYMKTITKDHKYEISGGFGVGDVNMINLTHSGYNPLNLGGRTYIGGPFYAGNPADNEGLNTPASTVPNQDYHRMYGRGIYLTCDSSLGKLCRWYQFGTDHFIEESFSNAGVTFEIDWGSPSSTNAYPKPKYDARLSVGAGGPGASTTIDVNDIASGLTLTASDTGSYPGNTITATWDFSP